MRTFLSKTSRATRARRTLSQARRHCRPLPDAARAQDGFMLLEVIISALIVGLIVVSTFAGFEVADRSSSNSREHGEGAVLAAEYLQQLRTDSASSLDAISQTAHQFSRTINGIGYTITESANFTGQPEGSGACSATETTRQSTNAVRLIVKVEWNEVNGKHTYTATGLVTPPTGSAIEVDAGNGAPGTVGVAGVSAAVKYTAPETKIENTLNGTTGTAGCVVFGGLPATSAIVEIPEALGYVTPTGTLKWPTKTIEIAPNLTTHYLVPFDKGGTITAHWEYKKSEDYEGKPIKGETFVVANKDMNDAPNFEVGATHFSYALGGEETATVLASEPKESATTPAATKYFTGDLFPFPEAKWEVYAGDCPENNPAVITSHEVADAEAQVEAGNKPEAAHVNVPLSLVTLNVYTGTGSLKPGGLASTQYKVVITNTKCAKVTPNNETEVPIRHGQETSPSGHLENPFQPFGEFELCVDYENAKAKEARSDKIKYDDTKEEGPTRAIYLGQISESERTKVANEAKASEEATKKARETSEKPAYTKLASEESALATKKTEETAKWSERESKEAALVTAQKSEETTKKTDVATEEAERTKWKEEVKKNEKNKKEGITKAKEEEDEAKQTTKRKERETKEKENEAKRASEQATLTTRKKEEEAAKTKREGEETTVAGKRAAQEAITKTAEKTEATTETSRLKRESEEVAEASKNEVTVEEGAKC
jgi:Tfp pilus assembly protein PilV